MKNIGIIILLLLSKSLFAQQNKYTVISVRDFGIWLKPKKYIDTIYVEREGSQFTFIVNQDSNVIKFSKKNIKLKQIQIGCFKSTGVMLRRYKRLVDTITYETIVELEEYFEPIPEGDWILKDYKGNIIKTEKQKYRIKNSDK